MLHSQTWGRGAQEALMLHCSLASSDAWRGVAGHMVDGLTMTGFDFRGHGKSVDWDSSGDYHKACTKDAESFLTRPMHLIGHSFGATVALRLALERPEMVRSLTMIEPVFFAVTKSSEAFAEHIAEFQPFVDAMQNGVFEAAARVFTEIWGNEAGWAKLSPAMRDYATARIGLVPLAAPALFEDSAKMATEGRLEAVSFPVLLIEGRESPNIVAAINTALAARLPDVSQVTIEGASHMAPITHSVQVAAEISRFLGL